MDLLFTLVGLLHFHLLKVIGEVVGGTRIHIPTRINRKSLGLAMRDNVIHRKLTSHKLAIIVDTQKLALKALEATRGEMPRLIT
jgi:hypothetical protein